MLTRRLPRCAAALLAEQVQGLLVPAAPFGLGRQAGISIRIEQRVPQFFEPVAPPSKLDQLGGPSSRPSAPGSTPDGSCPPALSSRKEVPRDQGGEQGTGLLTPCCTRSWNRSSSEPAGPAEAVHQRAGERPCSRRRFPPQKSPCSNPRGTSASDSSIRKPRSRNASACSGKCDAQMSASRAGVDPAPSTRTSKRPVRKSSASSVTSRQPAAASFPGNRRSTDHRARPTVPAARTHGTRSATRAPGSAFSRTRGRRSGPRSVARRDRARLAARCPPLLRSALRSYRERTLRDRALCPDPQTPPSRRLRGPSPRGRRGCRPRPLFVGISGTTEVPARSAETRHESRVRLPGNRYRCLVASTMRRSPGASDPCADGDRTREALRPAHRAPSRHPARSHPDRHDRQRSVAHEVIRGTDLDVWRIVHQRAARARDRCGIFRVLPRPGSGGEQRPGRSPRAIRAEDAAG